MLFNTLEFALFFLIVYAVYFILQHKQQNIWLLVASYVFYGSWDWRFLFLILLSTIVDYYCGLKIDRAAQLKERRLFLGVSIGVNLGILGVFKYFNFFAESLQHLAQIFGWSVSPTTINVILPVGISFYTFQTMSYTIDVYRKELKATTRFFDFSLYVSFFPQLVAGPIERAQHLLPQILKPRNLTWKKFHEGSFLIFLGLFQKIVVADNLARIVDPIFSGNGSSEGGIILLGIYAFAFQIFCDFAGYSNMARGLAKCLGFDIMLNFHVPYLAQTPSEFWRRWHISLSTWLRDYLYIPLGGNRKGSMHTLRNLIVVMTLGGLWHGAAWTFIIWGLYHGILLVMYHASQPLHQKCPKFLKAILFFHFVCLGWIFFRAQNMEQAWHMLSHLFTNFHVQSGLGLRSTATQFIQFVWLLGIIQYIQYKKDDVLFLLTSPVWMRAVMYFVIYYHLVIYGVEGGKEFIYFQF